MGASFATFLVRRVLAALAVLVGVSVLTFMTFHVLKPEVFPSEPGLLAQLWDFLTAAFLRLDLGRSWTIGRRPVSDMVAEGLPADLALLGGGIVIGTVVGLSLGAVCAIRPRSPFSRTLDGVATIMVCAPVYWVGLMAMYLFAHDIGALPVAFAGGQGTYRPLTDDPLAWVRGLVLPWLVISAPLAGMCLRMMRATMQDALGQDFMRTALGKGLRWPTVVRRHAVPAGASPVISLAGVTMATVVTNAILIERTFNIPGVLRLTTQATGVIEGRGTVDFPLLQGIVLTGALFVVAASLLADALHAWLDPRVRT